MTSENTAEDRELQLIRQLIRTTKSGEAVWEAASGTKFNLSLGTGKVTVASVDADDQLPFEISFLDGSGRAVEAVRSHRRGAGRDLLPTEYSKDLAELYKLAKRSALKVDDVLNEMLKELGGRQ